jgi:hypothetical protein
MLLVASSAILIVEMAEDANFHLLLCLEFPWENRVAGVRKKKIFKH